MSTKIRTNIASEIVQKNLNKAARAQEQEYAKLSSGKRITKAADDAAGLAIASKLEGSVRAMRQASRNANDSVSLVQTAEGGLNEISSMLVRLKELGIQAATDTVGEKERELIDLEFQQIIQGIDQISHSTQLNKMPLLDGTHDEGYLEFHIGIDSEDHSKIGLDINDHEVTSDSIGVEGLSVTDSDDALDAVDEIDDAINKVSHVRASFGAFQSRIRSVANNLETQTINHDEARSTIQDVDVADSSAKLAINKIKRSAATSVLAQANQIPLSSLSLL